MAGGVDTLSVGAGRASGSMCKDMFPSAGRQILVTISRVASPGCRYSARMNEPRQNLLVVDDDARLRDLLTRYLGEQGFEIRAAADSKQMDKLRSREHFHLIVLDLMLPGEDGLTICRRLRGEIGRAHV